MIILILLGTIRQHRFTMTPLHGATFITNEFFNIGSTLRSLVLTNSFCDASFTCRYLDACFLHNKYIYIYLALSYPTNDTEPYQHVIGELFVKHLWLFAPNLHHMPRDQPAKTCPPQPLPTTRSMEFLKFGEMLARQMLMLPLLVSWIQPRRSRYYELES